MTATLSPDCKEGGAEVIAGDVDGLYAAHRQGGAANALYSGHELPENSSCKDSPVQYNRIYGERAVGAFSCE
jgi:hypothetical protein